MDKNRIRGLPGWTSERGIAKSAAIKGRGGKSGGDAVKAVGLTSGGLRRVRKSRTERVRKARDRGAEVSRGHSVRQAAHWSGGFKSLRSPDEGGRIQRRG